MSPPKKTVIDLDLGGVGIPNGALIETVGDTTRVRVYAIDTAEDLVGIFRAARETGATKGTLFTGKVTSPTDLERYLYLAKEGGTRFGGRVEKLSDDRFKLIFDELPTF